MSFPATQAGLPVQAGESSLFGMRNLTYLCIFEFTLKSPEGLRIIIVCSFAPT